MSTTSSSTSSLRSNQVCPRRPPILPSFKDRVFQSLEGSSGILLVNSFREIEVEYIDMVSELVGKLVLPIGLLVTDDDDDDDNQKADDEIIKWLNNKAPSSVVYISFGSESYLSRSQIEELAHTLLIMIGKVVPINFIWALRFPRGEEMGILEALPEGFAAAVVGKGYMVEDWANKELGYAFVVSQFKPLFNLNY
ncbi:UDP-glucosyltransferase 29 [Linum grandiflorum]